MIRKHDYIVDDSVPVAAGLHLSEGHVRYERVAFL
jgi:hypothetical protein